MRRLLPRLLRLAPLALLAFVSAPVRAQDTAPADGVFVTVPIPITDGAIKSQIRPVVDAAKTDARRNVKKVVFDFNPDGKDAATAEFGPCYELAKYIRTLRDNGFQTIAFVHGKTTRHTVLPVIACEELVMSSSAQIGEVWSKDVPVTKDEQNIYQQYAGPIKAGPVMRMIDKDVKLVQAKKPDVTIYVDLRKVESKDPAYADVKVTNTNPIPLPAGVALYDTEKAQRFLLCQQQADTRPEVRERYQMSQFSEVGDPLGGHEPKPVRVVIEGLIDTALRERVRRQIETAKARKENTFFFVLETSAGGDPGAARELADLIVALGKDPEYRARTIAFVPGDAPELAAFVAFACQEIVMWYAEAGREAVLGDFSALVDRPKGQPRSVNPGFVQENLAAVAEQNGYPKLLVEGMFDKNLVIVRARNKQTGEQKLMSDAELQAQRAQGWDREPGRGVKERGELLKLTATTAKNLRIAKTVGNKDVTEVYALYGIDPAQVRSSEPSWLDNFGNFLRQTPVSILLVIVGIAGLVLELKAPGLVVPGVIAAVCFILFFWAQTQLGGQLIYLAIMLFLLGLALVGIEIFLIPGFGVTGVCGILLILAGLVLAGLDKAPESTSDWVDLIGRLLRYGLTMAGAGVLAFVVARYLPKIPYANRLMLVPPEDKPEGDEASPLPGADAAVTLLGQVGTATSMLRPAGMAKFGDRYIDVVTEGDFIAPGTPIQVIEVEGTRIVVKKV
jgi:membrane-bound serine protease (ClpP class)